MSISYPIALSAHDAFARLRTRDLPRAVREREAEALAGGRVAFVSEGVGPLFEREADALDAGKGLGGDGACKLVCRLKDAPRKTRKPVEPVFRDGERWPKAKAPQAMVWQWSVSYWKIMAEARKAAGTAPSKPARALRKKGGETLTPEEVLALTETPLTAFRPQKGLDFGLFDFPLPENPGIIIADE